MSCRDSPSKFTYIPCGHTLISLTYRISPYVLNKLETGGVDFRILPYSKGPNPREDGPSRIMSGKLYKRLWATLISV